MAIVPVVKQTNLLAVNLIINKLEKAEENVSSIPNMIILR